MDMEYLVETFTQFRESLFEFIKVRQLNFAVAALLTSVYMAYQFWHMMFAVKPVPLPVETPPVEEKPAANDGDYYRSRSNSRSYRVVRKTRGRQPYSRCYDYHRQWGPDDDD